MSASASARAVGPDDFTTTRSFPFREGAAQDFVMHAPDGIDHQEWITWTAIVPPERIALLHGEQTLGNLAAYVAGTARSH